MPPFEATKNLTRGPGAAIASAPFEATKDVTRALLPPALPLKRHCHCFLQAEGMDVYTQYTPVSYDVLQEFEQVVFYASFDGPIKLLWAESSRLWNVSWQCRRRLSVGPSGIDSSLCNREFSSMAHIPRVASISSLVYPDAHLMHGCIISHSSSFIIDFPKKTGGTFTASNAVTGGKCHIIV